MKTLYVIRHAKSSWDEPLLADFDRPLNKRGKHDAPKMGKRLRHLQVVPDLLLSSPAERALTTCLIIAEEVGYAKSKIKTDKKLYHADDAQILNVVQSLDNKFATVWIFGHNPGLTDFVNLLADADIDNIPTCGVVACSLNISSWDEANSGKGSVTFFDYPKKKS
ncbi:MAG: histidine phosphatase family protein [Cyclobacteriaceae bacterium]|nr:MAG: histidine phosphatase family protein [Cyclobacteriaceae bacterium]